MVVLGVYRYGASFVPNFFGKEVFRGGLVAPPLFTNVGSKGPMHLSVKRNTRPSM